MLLIKSAHKRLVQMNEMSEYKKCQTRRMTGRGIEHGAWGKECGNSLALISIEERGK